MVLTIVETPPQSVEVSCYRKTEIHSFQNNLQL